MVTTGVFGASSESYLLSVGQEEAKGPQLQDLRFTLTWWLLKYLHL